ncbi:MAG TPA: MBL fold metallo-hydrolase [Usitatibacter sp.]|nr:MBL fold metallo-hydrolase [Usitatibacter sp.]
MKTAFAAIALAAGAALAPAWPQDFSKVEIKTTKLAETVYMLTGAGGNIGVSAGGDTVFIVDDQYAPLTPKISEAIAKITPKPVQFVLNTHWHGDHTGGNENLGKQGAIIFSHENARKRLSSDQFIDLLKMKEAPSPRVALPVVTFTDSISFHLNGEEIRVFHVPRAHTDGDAIVHFTGSDVVHTGDVFWNGIYPFVDYSSGGSITGTIAACDKVLAMVTDRTRIIPGHGPLGTRAELQAYRDMLATISERVRQALNEGKTDDEIVKLGLTHEYDEKWKGMKPDMFIRGIAAGMRNSGS